jgi:hypothetical protein
VDLVPAERSEKTGSAVQKMRVTNQKSWVDVRKDRPLAALVSVSCPGALSSRFGAVRAT